MAEISFDLAALFEKAFGYQTQAFSPDFNEVAGNRPSLRDEQGHMDRDTMLMITWV